MIGSISSDEEAPTPADLAATTRTGDTTMNREQQIAIVMVMLLQNPKLGLESTVDGIAHHVFETKALGNDRYIVDYDQPTSWNECYAVSKEADERLRRGQSAVQFYGQLVDTPSLKAAA
jgi:hypothetical protein